MSKHFLHSSSKTGAAIFWLWCAKPIYQYDSGCHRSSNHLAALCEYRHWLKDLQKCYISRIDLRKMIMKFEETGGSGLLPGRGRKPVGTKTVQEVVTTEDERASSSM
ncbi:hypothetical protein TNCV_178601 [Trichonephila clavipes]|nr:hypothetical protein TNCV_178601 [Trichonephila clavipes]